MLIVLRPTGHTSRHSKRRPAGLQIYDIFKQAVCSPSKLTHLQYLDKDIAAVLSSLKRDNLPGVQCPVWSFRDGHSATPNGEPSIEFDLH